MVATVKRNNLLREKEVEKRSVGEEEGSTTEGLPEDQTYRKGELVQMENRNLTHLGK